MLQVEGWTQSSPRRKSSPPKPIVEEEPSDPPAVAVTDCPEELLKVLTSASDSLPMPEALNTGSRELGTRQRTHSAPPSHLSSLSRLLAQGTPPIEEVAENTSPSPPPRLSHSRSSSPLVHSSRPLPRPSSPFARPYSPSLSPRTRPSPGPVGRSSPLVSPLHSRSASPLPGPSLPHVRPSSPLAGPSYSQPSPPLTNTIHAQASPPFHASSSMRPASPLIGPSRPQPPSPLGANHSPIQPSPKSAKSALHSASRRSSSSSRPSSSSVFSTSRHPFTHSSSQAKAAPTTAVTDSSASVPFVGISSRSPEDLRTRGPATASPESSSRQDLPSVLLARRRTISASAYGSNQPSPLSVSENNRTQSSQGASQGALASLANSWGIGRKESGSVRHSIGRDASRSTHGDGSGSAGSTRIHRPGASDILRRYDDILPQERGSR